MAKIEFAPDIANISGRLSQKDNVVYAVNKKTGKTHRYDYNQGTQPNSTKQQAVKATFKTVSQYASAWWNANKEVRDANGDVTTEGSTNWNLIKTKYNAQNKYGNMYTYFLSLIDRDSNTITLGTTVIDITTTSGSSSSSGSSDSGTGNKDLETE